MTSSYSYLQIVYLVLEVALERLEEVLV
jgi:hypothetical protein